MKAPKVKEYVPFDGDARAFAPDAEFEGVEFTGIDFSAHSLRSVAFLDCRFTGCGFANQPLTNASMRGVEFVGCNLTGLNWCALKRLDGLSFRDSKLSYSCFEGLKLKGLSLRDCLAVEVDFSGADLSSADFAGTTLAGANFDRATLFEADFRAAQDYAFDLRTAKIRGAKFAFPEVVALITALGAKVEI